VELRPGYKRTLVGDIPDDWEVRALGEIGEVRMCKRVLKQQTRVRGEVPFFKIGTFGAEPDAFIDRTLFDELTRKYYFPKPGDVLISAAGTIGRVVVYNGCPAYFQDSNIVWIENNEKIVLNTYLRHIYDVTKWPVSNGGTVARLYNDSLKTKVFLPIAPLSEQYAVAAALSDVDALLTELGRLITKKRDIKKGAILELLTGQCRLPEFQGEWKECQLGALGSFAKGSGVKKDEAKTGPLPCVRYGELYTHHTDVIRRFNSHISSKVAKGALRLRKGDILFAGSGETKEEIGKCAALVDDIEVYAGGDIVVLRPSASCAEFLGYYLNTPYVQRQKASRGQGDAVVHINSRALASITLKIPATRHEQRAIAEVLLDMDAEIDALEDTIAKARAIKQGMMKLLLTGEVRLK